MGGNLPPTQSLPFPAPGPISNLALPPREFGRGRGGLGYVGEGGRGRGSGIGVAEAGRGKGRGGSGAGRGRSHVYDDAAVALKVTGIPHGENNIGTLSFGSVL